MSFRFPPAMDQTLHELHLMDCGPIITHPERNGILRSQPERLRGWVRLGCYAQVTAGSLTGVFWPGPQEDAWTWIDQGPGSFCVERTATTRARRPVKLRFAYEAIARDSRREKLAEALLGITRKRRLTARRLPYVPELASNLEGRKKKRFFFF